MPSKDTIWLMCFMLALMVASYLIGHFNNSERYQMIANSAGSLVHRLDTRTGEFEVFILKPRTGLVRFNNKGPRFVFEDPKKRLIIR